MNKRTKIIKNIFDIMTVNELSVSEGLSILREMCDILINYRISKIINRRSSHHADFT